MKIYFYKFCKMVIGAFKNFISDKELIEDELKCHKK